MLRWPSPTVLLLLALGLASAPLSAARAPLSAHEDPTRLEHALDAVDVDSLEADVRFLADEELAGRDTPSEGLETAALYFAARLGRLGFSPAGSGDFYHRWRLVRTGLDPTGSGLLVKRAQGTERRLFQSDYYLARSSHAFPCVTDGAVVSAGDGSGDAFEGRDLTGSWALVFDHGASVRRILRRARAAGALGVLFGETEHVTKGYEAKYARIAEVTGRDGLTYRPEPLPASQDLPYLMLRRHALLALTGGEETLAPGTRLPLRLREERVVRTGDVEVKNVAGFWPGRDPELAREVLIVSAHYDHLGVAEDGAVYHGADDNASGSSGLLAVAEALAAYGPLRRSVLLLWVSGEEKGLWGSDAWARAPELPPGCTAVANVNIDMIGRTAPEELYLTPTDAHPAFNRVAQAAYDLAPLEGFPTLASQDEDWNRSDHANFAKHLAIPVAFLSAGEHPDYHRTTDTAEKIDYAKLARITRLVVRLLDRLEDGPLR